MTPKAYTSQLIALLPRGDFWEGFPTLKALLAAWAEELSRVHGRMLDLLREADPSQAVETLSDWERVLALPDECMPLAASIEERQQAVVAKLIGQGGQSIAYYTALAAALGYTITITEFDPWTCVSDCTYPLYGEAYAYAWQVNVLTAPDGRLVDGQCLDLECVLTRANQAHLSVLFNYEALEA